MVTGRASPKYRAGAVSLLAFELIVAGCAGGPGDSGAANASRDGAATGGLSGSSSHGGSSGGAGIAGPGNDETDAGGAGDSAGLAGRGGETGGSRGGGAAGHSTGGSAGSSVGGVTGSGTGGAASRDGGVAAAGGTAGSTSGGGNAGSGGTPAVNEPCDIFASGNTPCVAAHSTVRALYRSYAGSLYQVRRASDNTTKDIAVLSPGGFASAATQDAFCTGTSCTIAIIYDQSGRGNHLRKAPGGERKTTPDAEASATALKLTIGGHSVYGVRILPGTGYRNNTTSGIATGDQPETEYMVTSGSFYNSGCCFDYGNAETDNHADGAATMEAVYFGNNAQWGKGEGSGPWVMADLENGLYPGATFAANPKDPSQTSAYVTAMVIGRSGSFALKGGDAQVASLATIYDGARPSGYNPMKKQGAIVLGIGGDNSPWGQGTFFEGAITSGATADATADAIQTNIAAAGYGR